MSESRRIQTNDLMEPRWIIDPCCPVGKGECRNLPCILNMYCVNYTGEDKPKEQINHPAHYGGEENLYEVIKVARAWSTDDEFYGWLKLTILKYQGRLGKKDLTETEIGKMIWYIQYLQDWIKERGYKPK